MMDQKQFVRKVNDPFDKFLKIVVFALGDIKLKTFEFELLKYIHNNPPFSSKSYDDVCNVFGVEKQSVRNCVSSLKKKKLIQLNNKVYTVHKALQSNGDNIELNIKLLHVG